jgi:hypothetical protein
MSAIGNKFDLDPRLSPKSSGRAGEVAILPRQGSLVRVFKKLSLPLETGEQSTT